MTYQIKDWPKHFENNKSKERDRCSFVCMPNKQDGMGLHRILALENGAALFGVWCLLLQKASRQPRPRMGWFTDDGTPNGVPWDLEDLAFQWRQPTELIHEACNLFCSSRIDWLKVVPSTAQKLGGHSAGTLTPESARGTSESARGTLPDGHFPAKSAQERKKEEKERKKEAGEGHREELDEDIFSNETKEPLTDSQLISKLSGCVRWTGTDPEGTQANITMLAEMVREYGAQAVDAVAKECRSAAGKRVWPDVVLERLLEQSEQAHPREPNPDEDPPTPQACLDAVALVKRIGFDECQKLVKTCVDGEDEKKLIWILEANKPAAQDLLDAYAKAQS